MSTELKENTTISGLCGKLTRHSFTGLVLQERKVPSFAVFAALEDCEKN